MVVNPKHIARVREQLKKWNEPEAKDHEIEGMFELCDVGGIDAVQVLHDNFNFPMRLCAIGAACNEILQTERQPIAA